MVSTTSVSASRTSNSIVVPENPKPVETPSSPTSKPTDEQSEVVDERPRASRADVSSSRSMALMSASTTRARVAELVSASEPTLKLGSRGDAVKRAQERLVAHGYLPANDPDSTDGIFGPRTHDAVVRFQDEHGLRADGMVGPKTRAALKEQPTQPQTPTSPTPTTSTPPAEMEEKAKALGVNLQRPADVDTNGAEKMWFLKTGARTLKPHPMTEEQGQRLYFDGMLPIASSKEAFKAVSPTYKDTPDWAKGAPCSYSAAMRMEAAYRKAGQPQLADHFKNTDNFGPTHNLEIEMRNMGFNYYPKKDYVAPKGAIGCWSRYTFPPQNPTWEQHTGHVYTILEDKGPDGKKDMIADNNGAYNHVYGNPGKCEGFWLPPGVYPQRRNGSGATQPTTPAQPDTTTPPTSGGTTQPTTGTPPPTTPVTAPTEPAVDPSTLPTLRKGAKGEAVERLQRALAKAGFSPGGIDGDFGVKTEAAVEAFQRAKNLEDDGVVGPRTWRALLGGTGGTTPPPSVGDGSMTTERAAVQTVGGVTAYRAAGKSGLAFKAGMTIDADGSPRAYNPQDTGIDRLANAKNQRTGEWCGIAVNQQTGKPYVQGPNDPYPGYYVSTTSLKDNRFPPQDPRNNVDSEKIPFIALPPKLLKQVGVELGDFLAVRNSRNGKVAYALVVDQGPSNRVGEGSIRLANELGVPSSPINGGAGSGIEYVVFPGSGNGKPRTYEEIQTEGDRLFKAWGGVEQLKSTTR